MYSLNLYIHIPYCFSKCPYCGFFSCVGMEKTYDEYFKTLVEERSQQSEIYKDRVVRTIYIGGGTPNLVPSKYIVTMLQHIKRYFNVSKNAEVTIELYPEYITEESLSNYKKAGVNRLSIGLQSTNNEQLKQLSRRYTYEDFLNGLNIAHKVGYTNIGVDLIFGYPKHTLNDWKKTLDLITKLDIQHLSCYSLEVEEGTVYGRMNENGKLNLPSEIIDRQMYHYTCEYLINMGFDQYEISNFAQKGFECKHNLDFWNYNDYLGLGAGAYSRVNGRKSHNPESIPQYINHAWNIEDETIDTEEIEKEKIMLGLRLNKGIKYIKNQYIKEYMTRNKNMMRLNKKGKDMYNVVVKNILN